MKDSLIHICTNKENILSVVKKGVTEVSTYGLSDESYIIQIKGTMKYVVRLPSLEVVSLRHIDTFYFSVKYLI